MILTLIENFIDHPSNETEGLLIEEIESLFKEVKTLMYERSNYLYNKYIPYNKLCDVNWNDVYLTIDEHHEAKFSVPSGIYTQYENENLSLQINKLIAAREILEEIILNLQDSDTIFPWQDYLAHICFSRRDEPFPQITVMEYIDFIIPEHFLKNLAKLIKHEDVFNEIYAKKSSLEVFL